MIKFIMIKFIFKYIYLLHILQQKQITIMVMYIYISSLKFLVH